MATTYLPTIKWLFMRVLMVLAAGRRLQKSPRVSSSRIKFENPAIGKSTFYQREVAFPKTFTAVVAILRELHSAALYSSGNKDRNLRRQKHRLGRPAI